MPDPIEQVAATICSTLSGIPWSMLSEKGKGGYRKAAQAAVDALQLTEERVPLIPPQIFREPMRLVGPWVEGSDQ